MEKISEVFKYIWDLWEKAWRSFDFSPITIVVAVVLAALFLRQPKPDKLSLILAELKKMNEKK